jgi:hypothetical protein
LHQKKNRKQQRLFLMNRLRGHACLARHQDYNQFYFRIG